MTGSGRRAGRGGLLHTVHLSRALRGDPHAAVTTTVPLQWSFTVAVTIPVTTVTTFDADKWSVPFKWSFTVDVIGIEDPPPATDPYIQRVSVTMPTPTLVNGKPVQPWTPTLARSDWGRLQLLVGGYDRSRPRGVPFLPVSDAETEPFGWAEASFSFPGLTEFDDLEGTWGFTALTPVTLRRKDPGGTFHVLYRGFLASLEPDTGKGPSIQCVGLIYRMDLLKEQPRLLARTRDLGQIIANAFNQKRDRHGLPIGHMADVITGITDVAQPDFSPLLTGTVSEYLARAATSSGQQYTIMPADWTPVLALKDTTTVHATVSHGAPGVDVQLSKDFTTGTTGVFGSGSNGHCTWMGARFPNLQGRTAPTFPLAVGHTFVADDGQTGFAPFSNFLRAGGYTAVSGDSYLSADVDEVERFQAHAGITVDGIVGAQTWEAAFTPGFNQGSIDGAYVDVLYERPETRKYNYNALGALVGPNPAFDPSVPRIEEYVPFGDNVPKQLAVKSAKQIVNWNYPAGRVGTITLTSDPTEMSRFDIKAGMNVKVTNYAGGFVLCHVTRRERNWDAGSVILTADEKARDHLTVAAIEQRTKEVASLTQRPLPVKRRARIFDDYGQWLCEDGAGEFPWENQQGGFWNVQRIAAAPKGTIERVSMCAGTGLTEALLDENLSSNPPATIPGAARFCVAIFTQPVQPNDLANLPGLSHPLTDMADGSNPWDHNEDALTNTYGKIYAAGGPGQACGFYPNNDPGDGTDVGLTGRHEDGGGISFGPTGHYWLWVAVWSPVSCYAGGRIYPGAPG